MIELIELTTRKVNFHGVTLQIPRHLPFVAANKNGEIWCYDQKPYFIGDESEWDIDEGDQLRLGTAHLNGLDWKLSLAYYDTTENVIYNLN